MYVNKSFTTVVWSWESLKTSLEKLKRCFKRCRKPALCIFSSKCFVPLFSRDMPCIMSLIEIKSLFRLDDIIASATQPITTLELSAHSGQGLQDVLSWLESITVKWTWVHSFLLKWCYSHRTYLKAFGNRCQCPQCAKTLHTPFWRGFNNVLSVGRWKSGKTWLLMLNLWPDIGKYGDSS